MYMWSIVAIRIYSIYVGNVANKFLHALVLLRMVCKRIIARDSDFDWRK